MDKDVKADIKQEGNEIQSSDDKSENKEPKLDLKDEFKEEIQLNLAGTVDKLEPFEDVKTELLVKQEAQSELNLCEFCGKCFIKKTKLSLHLRKIHNVKFEDVKHKCERCGKEFEYLCVKKEHVMRVHEQIILNIHKCDYCEETRKNLEHLKGHIDVVHKNIRKFMCEYCPKAYGLSWILRNHIRTVHDGIKYECELCEIPFKNQGLLNRASFRQI